MRMWTVRSHQFGLLSKGVIAKFVQPLEVRICHPVGRAWDAGCWVRSLSLTLIVGDLTPHLCEIMGTQIVCK